MAGQRGQWNSRLGFILAAAGSAVGLGNIWRFPYITGENGGGWFILIYLICIVLVGLPVMMGEILVGRTTQKSPIGAIRELSRPASPWLGLGWMGIAAAFLMLSFYSIVAGWTLHYLSLSAQGVFETITAETSASIFAQDVVPNPWTNLSWHFVFMFLTMFIVLGGVQRGIELGTKIMMPMLLTMMCALLVLAMVSEPSKGFIPAAKFAFNLETPPPWTAVLEALGQAFFTLSIGMGAMITYGSYLKEDDDVVSTASIVSGLDTAIALLACLTVFPFIFRFGLEPSAGPGLVFTTIPVAFSDLPYTSVWCVIFFGLLFFAALTSAISLLEVVVSYFVDEWRMSRAVATIVCGIAIAIFGIPSALSGGAGLFGAKFREGTMSIAELLGRTDGMNWFDAVDYTVSNLLLPLGGLFMALFISWFISGKIRRDEFHKGTKFGFVYYPWLFVLRFVVPIAVILVFLNAIGVLTWILELVMPSTDASGG